MEPPEEEWLFLVTNKKLPEVKITYDTETQKITNIKGIQKISLKRSRPLTK